MYLAIFAHKKGLQLILRTCALGASGEFAVCARVSRIRPRTKCVNEHRNQENNGTAELLNK